MEQYAPLYPGSDMFSDQGFLTFFSSFWTQIFSDRGIAPGMASAGSLALAQQYQAYMETVNCLSIETTPIYERQLICPLVIRKSRAVNTGEPLIYGQGVVYGAQPSNGVFTSGAVFEYGGTVSRNQVTVSIPGGGEVAGAVIVNRLVEPSVSLQLGIDWFFVDGGKVVFTENPFNNELIPRRQIPVDGGFDEEIVLWMFDVDRDKATVYQQYGFIFTPKTKSSKEYKELISACMNIFPGGPSLLNIDSFISASCGHPVIKEVSEVVESIQTFMDKTIVATDKGAYVVLGGVRDSVFVGATLKAGSPLSAASIVFDSSNKNSWWREIEAISLSGGFIPRDMKGNLFFVNAIKPVTYKGETTDGGNASGLAEFEVGGLPKDVEKFWAMVRARSIESEKFLGPIIWRNAGATSVGIADDNKPLPDYKQKVFINPLQFIVENVMGNNLICAKIDYSKITSNLFFRAVHLIRKAIPAHTAIIVFLDIPESDEYTFSLLPDGSEGMERQNPVHILSNTPSSFTAQTKNFWLDGDDQPLSSGAEAIGLEVCTELISETFDLSLSTNVGESLEIKLEPNCRT